MACGQLAPGPPWAPGGRGPRPRAPPATRGGRKPAGSPRGAPGGAPGPASGEELAREAGRARAGELAEQAELPFPSGASWARGREAASEALTS